MSLIQPKQVHKVISAPIKISNFAVGSGVSQANVSTPISAALQLAGNNSTSVPYVISSTVFEQGVVVTGPVNRTDIWDATSKLKLQTVGGEEIYGRVVFEVGNYVLKMYYLPSTGIETTYTTTANISIDFDFAYRFNFNNLPSDALVSQTVRNISQDPKGQNSPMILERLTVTATNLLTQLANIPTAPSKTILSINGQEQFCLGASPSFAITGTNITWNAGNAGYALETSDVVYVKYYL